MPLYESCGHDPMHALSRKPGWGQQRYRMPAVQVIAPGAPGADSVSMKAKVGRLYMVDLAGSERLKKSLSPGALTNQD